MSKVWTDADLRYAATVRCPCGAGMAYAPSDTGEGTPFNGPSAWDCSAILKGEAIPSGQPGAVKHEARLPFAFYEIKSEDQPSADGRTTRPEGAAPRPPEPPRQPKPTLTEAVSTLENYGDHHGWCEKADRQMPQWETATCTCGFDAQLARLREAVGPQESKA